MKKSWAIAFLNVTVTMIARLNAFQDSKAIIPSARARLANYGMHPINFQCLFEFYFRKSVHMDALVMVMNVKKKRNLSSYFIQEKAQLSQSSSKLMVSFLFV